MGTEEVVLTIKYFVLGLIQGFTEPIPISSSGHVIIAQRLMGIEQKGLSFEILANTASFLAIIFIFREDLIRLSLNSLSYIRTRNVQYKNDFMFMIYIGIGTIPAVILGLSFKDQIAEHLTSLTTIAISLFITGLALWLIRNFKGIKRDGDLSVKDALIVGFAQALALIPGISRSGSTVIASIAVGMKQETALRFSFILYIPVSIGGMVLGVSDLRSEENWNSLALPYTIAFIATLITTYFSMKWLMSIMERGNLKYFAYYCFAMGTFLLLFF